ncbi:DUF2530 domain-containing protein [Streptomyces otsuchiensis]|uniref:DUF2530 domain-containing protein n=1 Tax=Streptomyces otsuchiensis TaxID=2681388 RepID=UPI0010316B5C|nr:DUF2530 domain-containing protein [Streptomyces otsuchiensis]
MRWGELTSGKREAPAPLEGNITAVVGAGTALWAVAFLVQLPFYGQYADDGRTQWIWTCLAGVGLGFFGLWYNSRRVAAIRRDAERAERAADGQGDAAPGGNDGPDTDRP